MISLAMDLIAQSPVVSLVVSLPTLPEPPLKVLQSLVSHLGPTVACSGWDRGRHSLAVLVLS